MRKMFLSALACVAFAGSSFASNEIVNKEIISDDKSQVENSVEIISTAEADKKPCKFRIKGKDVYGRPFNTEWRTAGNVTSSDCDGAKDSKILELKRQGATIEKASTDWGN